jgi:hypothetical protein
VKVEFPWPRVTASSEDGKSYRLEHPFPVRIDGILIVIPKGFESDLDSVPRLPLAYWLMKGRAFKSAWLHDFLYATGAPRKYADEAIKAGMEAEKVGAVYRTFIYGGVRAGGWKAYNEWREYNEDAVS